MKTSLPIKFVPKGWGFEKWIVNCEEYCGKLLYFVVPTLKEMNFQVDPEDSSQSVLVVTNPPVVSLEGVEPPFETEETPSEGEE